MNKVSRLAEFTIDAPIPPPVIERMRHSAYENIAGMLDDISGRSRGETPIERALFGALLVEMATQYNEFGRLIAPEPGVRCIVPPIYNDGDQHGLALAIESQIDLFGWKIDFIARSRREKGGFGPTLAIECDGHEFHERTKEQAIRDRRRDRLMQSKGLTVFRFTGSEIYADPSGCARSILKWATSAYCA